MSSTQSVPQALPTEVRDLLVGAACSVCETTFFAFAEPAMPELVATLADVEHWYHSEVSFSGPSSGQVHVSVPQGLARDLFAAFLGFADTGAANDAEVSDVVGEFTNMVCGSWLTLLGGDTCFTLTHPEVTGGGLPAPADHALVLSVNDQPVVVRAEFA